MQFECNSNQPNISVIVPVYKVEPYLKTCVESILEQSYKDYEILLVDDGSPDNCPAICDEYAAKYNFIKVIHKQNGGLSDARNAGMKLASGKYITFVDSDDCISERYLEYLWEGITMGGDISLINYVMFQNDEEFISKKSDKNKNVTILDSKEALKKVFYHIIGDFYAWGLLLPAEIAREYPFPLGKLYEDTLVSCKYYLAAKKVGYVQHNGYYYRQRPESIIHQAMGMKHILDKLEATDCMVAACKGDSSVEKAVRTSQFNNYCNILLRLPTFAEEAPSEYARIKRFIESTGFTVFKDSNCRLKVRVKGLGVAIFGIRFLYWVGRAYYKN